MRPQQAAIGSFRFSTDGLSPRERGEALRSLRDRGIMTVEPLRHGVAHAAIRKQFMPGADILSGVLSGLRQFGTRHGGDNIFVCVNLSGDSSACQRGREITLHSSDAVLFSSADGGCTINRPASVQFVGLRLPYRTLAPVVAHLDNMPMRLIPKETGSLRLLINYLRAIDMGHALDTPELLPVVASHIHDLIALSVGATRDAAAIAEERGVRAARLQAIKSDIAQNLSDCELSVSGVAMRHRVTPRYVQMLFASEGITFSEFVLERRLALAHRLLTDRRLANRPVSSIAFDVGFGDVSYFNRTFRRRYDATPSDIRHSCDSKDASQLSHTKLDDPLVL
jgi:AraC-like DNA-binding protein